VILPCFRGAEIARRSADRLAGFLAAGPLSWEVVVVDDGGGDFGAGPWLGDQPITLVELPENRGKGAAVREGMLEATGRVRVFTDVDLPYDLELLPLIASYVLDHGYHLVVGDRTLPDSTYGLDVGWQRSLGSRVFSELFGRLVTGGFFDTQCGLKGFRGDVAELLFPRCSLDRFAFDVELIYIALKHRLDIKRIPVQLRNNETSTVRLHRDGFRMARDVLRIKRNQLRGLYDCPELTRLLCDDVARSRDDVTRDYVHG